MDALICLMGLSETVNDIERNNSVQISYFSMELESYVNELVRRISIYYK